MGWLNMDRARRSSNPSRAYGAAQASRSGSCRPPSIRLLAVGTAGSGDGPSMTFVATVNAIAYCGAEPVFA